MRPLLLLALLTTVAPLRAQDAPGPDVRGVWEMTAVEKAPPGDGVSEPHVEAQAPIAKQDRPATLRYGQEFEPVKGGAS